MKLALVCRFGKFSLAAVLAATVAIVATSLLAQQTYENPFEDAPTKKSDADKAKEKTSADKGATKKRAPEASRPATNLDDPFGTPELKGTETESGVPTARSRTAPTESTRPGPSDTAFPPADTTAPAPADAARRAPPNDLRLPDDSPTLAPPESREPRTEPSDRSAAPPAASDNPFEDMAPAPELDRSVMPDRQTDAAPSSDSTGGQLPSAADDNGQIVQLLTEKKFDQAIAFSESRVKQSPNDPAAHFFLGVSYRMINRLDDAIKAFTKAADLAGDVPEAGEIHLRRGIAWLHKGEYRIAHADFETAAGMIANDPRPELWKGIALVKQNKIRDSITAYSTALRYEPRYEAALMNRGLAYLAIDEEDMAVTDFDEVIRINPENALAFHRRGVALGRRGNFAESIDSYSAAIRIDPKLAEAYFNRGLLLQRAGQSSRANADAAKARELEPQIQQRASTARVARQAS